MSTPTLELYSNLEQAYSHFNADLFDNRLPPCLITLRSTNRIYGYHHSDRFINLKGDLVDELGLHPGHFTLRSVETVLSTLVHEMVHHWQHHFGSPTRTNPHNAEWVAKMKAIGLQPSQTGLPGGKTTGRQVSHYIVPEGPYDKACKSLVAQGFHLKWFDRHLPAAPEREVQIQVQLQEAGLATEKSPRPIENLPKPPDNKPVTYLPQPKKPSTRQRYTCPGCDARVWASKKTAIMCMPCGQPFQGDEDEDPNPSST
jgi:hypothetical protein